MSKENNKQANKTIKQGLSNQTINNQPKINKLSNKQSNKTSKTVQQTHNQHEAYTKQI